MGREDPFYGPSSNRIVRDPPSYWDYRLKIFDSAGPSPVSWSTVETVYIPDLFTKQFTHSFTVLPVRRLTYLNPSRVFDDVYHPSLQNDLTVSLR